MYAEEAAILDKVLLEADGAEHKSLPKLLQGEPNVSRDAEKYEQELKNTITRELMYAEEAAILDKLMDSGGKFGGSKKCYRVSGGLHGIGLLFVKIATTITLISILAQPVHADFFSIFGKLPYRSYGWDVKKSYETFHGGIFHSEGVLEKGAKYKGVDLMRWPQRVALPPRGWLLLEVNATGEDDRTTLAIRNDNLFIIAFANKAGQWFYFSGGEALLNEPATNAIRLPFTASYGPNGLGLSSFRGRKEEMMKSLVFGENEALEAMRTLSNFDIARSDTEATKGALLVMTLMVSEAQRFKKVSAPILEAWPTAVSLLEVEFLWYWGEVSCSMLTYLVKNEYPAADIRYAHKFGPAGVGTYDLALLTVDLLQFPYACLETNGILEEFNFMKPES